MKKDYNMASTHFIIVKEDLSNSNLTSMIDELEKVDGINKMCTCHIIIFFHFI